QKHVPMPESTLVSNIVNGKERTNLIVGVAIVVGFTQIDWNESGLPIVGMDQVRPVVQKSEQFQSSSGKERETFSVVRIVTPLAAWKRELVKTASLGRIVSVEVSWLIDKVHGNIRVRESPAPERGGDLAVSNRNRERMAGRYNRRLSSSSA